MLFIVLLYICLCKEMYLLAGSFTNIIGEVLPKFLVNVLHEKDILHMAAYVNDMDL